MPKPRRPLHHASSEVGLAEIVQAMHHLRPADDPSRVAVAASLGFGWQAAAPIAATTPTPGPALAPVPSENFTSARTPELTVPRRAPVRAQRQGREPEILTPAREEPPTVEALFGAAIPGEVTEVEPSQPAHLEPVARPPLLHPRWFRGIAGALLATAQPARDIDWRFLERRIARGLPIDRLPWRRRPTLKRGVEVLLDHSESMQPFWRDTADLLAQLRRLVGQRSVRAWRFRMEKWRAPATQWRWLADAPHAFTAGTPLLLVSDFGLGGGRNSSAGPWLAALRRLRLESAPILALVPVPASHWPAWLGQLTARAFVWDRETSPQAIRRVLARIR